MTQKHSWHKPADPSCMKYLMISAIFAFVFCLFNVIAYIITATHFSSVSNAISTAINDNKALLFFANYNACVAWATQIPNLDMSQPVIQGAVALWSFYVISMAAFVLNGLYKIIVTGIAKNKPYLFMVTIFMIATVTLLLLQLLLVDSQIHSEGILRLLIGDGFNKVSDTIIGISGTLLGVVIITMVTIIAMKKSGK